MAKKGILKGAKINSKHSSFIDVAAPIIQAAKILPEVSKVVLGEIVRVRAGKKRIKFVSVNAGFRVVVRGHNSQQTLFVYTNNPTSTQEALLRTWEKK